MARFEFRMQRSEVTQTSFETHLVTGATGFVGSALIEALTARGWPVIAASRRPPVVSEGPPGVSWRVCDLTIPNTLPQALEGVQVAYYLVHSMGGSNAGYLEQDRRCAESFASVAASAGVRRIVYLGGPAPADAPSDHLKSRLQVGEILRSGAVPTVELRASMVIGHGSASWQIVRDLAMRLPFMVLPRWLRSLTRPVALQDVIEALLGASQIPLESSVWFDIPGPDILSGREVLERIAAIRGRRILILEVPFLTPSLSALWLRLVTRTDYRLARELVMGLRSDLLPHSDEFWGIIGHTDLISFDDAARLALAAEETGGRRSAKRPVDPSHMPEIIRRGQ
jgi:uncharacterized protein YbjT (DUF2867 family)